MIEVEKRIKLTEQIKKDLIAQAQFIKNEEIKDIYYDKPNYELSANDIWLRNRNGNFELKIGIKGMGIADRYRELEDEQEVKSFLNIAQDQNIKDFLDKNGFEAFCEFNTKREKYKFNDFSIEIEESQSDDFDYKSAEVEIMVEDENEIQSARQKIMDFLRERNIPLQNLFFGKILEYIKIKRQNHFIELVKRGVV